MASSMLCFGGGIRAAAQQAVAAPVRAALSATLALALALAPTPGVGGWDAARMNSAAAGLGPRAEQGARDLQELLQRNRGADAMTRLVAVNDHFNRSVSYVEDATTWQQDDYWASPLETLSRRAGDCEDFAIAKYFVLLAAGVALPGLRLVYVRAVLPAEGNLPSRSQAHMVLAYYADNQNDPLILDSLVGEIRRASARPDLTPVFSFNSEGLWAGAGGPSAGDPMARLSRWRDVVRKARAEGFD